MALCVGLDLKLESHQENWTRDLIMPAFSNIKIIYAHTLMPLTGSRATFGRGLSSPQTNTHNLSLRKYFSTLFPLLTRGVFPPPFRICFLTYLPSFIYSLNGSVSEETLHDVISDTSLHDDFPDVRPFSSPTSSSMIR